MSKHTPGPWRVSFSEGGCHIFGDGIDVADCPRQGQMDEANAHLIAAAPELLEALENIEQIHKGKDNPEVARRMIVNIARKAIAKAKGEKI